MPGAARGMPDRLGRYAVRRRIGAGGFATVWLAYDEQLDAPVAIKVLADNWTDDHQVRTRFVEEGRYLRRVESPHVVTVYDAGELDDGRPYLVMTYADQGTLADRLAEARADRSAQALEVVRQVAAGLQALHDRGDAAPRRQAGQRAVPHRRRRPSRPAELRAMVGDLGLGKALDISSRLTMIAGTPSFVAPEQAQGETPDARADQYSLGVLTYLLLGRPPAVGPRQPARGRRAGPAAALHAGRAVPRRRRGGRTPRAGASTARTAGPTVTAYADAARRRPRRCAAATRPRRRAPGCCRVDPELTQPGAAPSPLPARPAAARRCPRREPAGWPRRLGRSRVVPCSSRSAPVALAGSPASEPRPRQRRHDRPTSTVERRDRHARRHGAPTGTRAVADAVAAAHATDERFPALSVGTGTGWTDARRRGRLPRACCPAPSCPTSCPQHPECTSAASPSATSRATRRSPDLQRLPGAAWSSSGWSRSPAASCCGCRCAAPTGHRQPGARQRRRRYGL